MEAGTIALLIGLGTLIVERAFKYLREIKKSDCLGIHVEMKDSVKKQYENI